MISAWLIEIRGAFGAVWCLCLGISLIASPPIGSWTVVASSNSICATLPSELLDATLVCEDHTVLRRDYPGQVCSIAKVAGGDRRALVAADRPRRDARQPPLRRAAGGASASPATCSPPASSAWSRRTSSSAAPTRKARARYEYFLTEKGLDLWPALIALLDWGDRYSPDPDGPPMLIVHKECGGAVSDRGICESCGKVLTARDANQVPGPGASLSVPRRGIGR